WQVGHRRSAGDCSDVYHRNQYCSIIHSSRRHRSDCTDSSSLKRWYKVVWNYPEDRPARDPLGTWPSRRTSKHQFNGHIPSSSCSGLGPIVAGVVYETFTPVQDTGEFYPLRWSSNAGPGTCEHHRRGTAGSVSTVK